MPLLHVAECCMECMTVDRTAAFDGDVPMVAVILPVARLLRPDELLHTGGRQHLKDIEGLGSTAQVCPGQIDHSCKMFHCVQLG